MNENRRNNELAKADLIEEYAERLIDNTDNGKAVAYKIIRSTDGGKLVKRAEFVRENGGYTVSEFRNDSPEPFAVTYMIPFVEFYKDSNILAEGDWATGRIYPGFEKKHNLISKDVPSVILEVVESYWESLPEESFQE